jgi:gluconate 2-dehydrogenase gamma chain
MADSQAGRSSMEGRFFDAHQRATIEAAMARIIPTADQPGAREAETVEFLDRYLSGLDFIYAKPDGSGFEKLEGKRAEAWQRRIAILGAKYVEGIKELDRRSQSQFGADFVRLTTEQQDTILAGMERPALQAEAGLEEAQAVAGFAPVEPALQQTSTEIELDFFPLLALHTRQGFYADSIYGGNKNRVGWKLIGFEGPESLAETHAGRFTTLPFFAEQQIDWEEQKHYGAKA